MPLAKSPASAAVIRCRICGNGPRRHHAVIFEKARSTTSHVKAFRHFMNGTVPEVKLSFDVEGKSWTIHERFAGQAGKAVLSCSNARVFSTSLKSLLIALCELEEMPMRFPARKSDRIACAAVNVFPVPGGP